MKRIFSFLVLILFLMSLFSREIFKISVDFDDSKNNDFVEFVGNWHLDKDDKNIVYAVDGRKWERGLVSEGIVAKAKGLYGERYAEFLDNLEAYKYFPLTIFKNVKNFSNGEITVRFKTISGRIDQAAGIAFDIKQNGDYLVIRANPLENNLVLFRMKHGKRRAVQWIRNVKTPSKVWHDLKVEINGNRVKGYLNGKLYIDYKNKTDISGKIGLWSKADSYVFFDDFTVQKSLDTIKPQNLKSEKKKISNNK